MMKHALSGICALALVGCAGLDMGLSPHIRDLPAAFGSIERVSIGDRGTPGLVLYERADRVKDICHRLLPHTDAGGCAIWSNDGGPHQALGGFGCLIVSPPNQRILAWEIGRCEGTNAAKGVTSGGPTAAQVEAFVAAFGEADTEKARTVMLKEKAMIDD